MRKTIFLLVFPAIFAFQCEMKPTKHYQLVMKGSESMHETFDALKNDFEQVQDTIEVVIEGGGSRTSFSAVQSGAAKIGLSSFQFNLDSILGPGHGIRERVVAYDGIVLISNQRNPVRQLTYTQISDIFAGRLTDWSQLGGPAGEITPVIRDQNSGTQQFFTDFFRLDTVTPMAIVASENPVIVAKVKNNPGSIGFIGFAYFTESVNSISLPSVSDESLFVAPSVSQLNRGTYPLKRSLLIYFKNENDPAVRAFLQYLHTPRAKAVIESFGLVVSNN